MLFSIKELLLFDRCSPTHSGKEPAFRRKPWGNDPRASISERGPGKMSLFNKHFGPNDQWDGWPDCIALTAFKLAADPWLYTKALEIRSILILYWLWWSEKLLFINVLFKSSQMRAVERLIFMFSRLFSPLSSSLRWISHLYEEAVEVFTPECMHSNLL